MTHPTEELHARLKHRLAGPRCCGRKGLETRPTVELHAVLKLRLAIARRNRWKDSPEEAPYPSLDSRPDRRAA